MWGEGLGVHKEDPTTLPHVAIDRGVSYHVEMIHFGEGEEGEGEQHT